MVRRNAGEVGMEISCHSMCRWFRIADGLLTRYTAFIANIVAIFVSIAGDVWPPGVRAVEAYCRQLGHTPGRIAEWPCLGVKSKVSGRTCTHRGHRQGAVRHVAHTDAGLC
jgi:hypothetical protein